MLSPSKSRRGRDNRRSGTDFPDSNGIAQATRGIIPIYMYIQAYSSAFVKCIPGKKRQAAQFRGRLRGRIRTASSPE
jgi:hypothetical protein